MWDVRDAQDGTSRDGALPTTAVREVLITYSVDIATQAHVLRVFTSIPIAIIRRRLSHFNLVV